MRFKTLGLALLLVGVGALACSPAAAPVSPQAPVKTVPLQPGAATPPSPTGAATGDIQTFEILQVGNNFQPNRVTVKAGAPVRFLLRNDDAEEHNIMSAQIQFPQNQQNPGGTYTVDWVAPTQRGEYEAFCAFHAPAMTMKIIVQ